MIQLKGIKEGRRGWKEGRKESGGKERCAWMLRLVLVDEDVGPRISQSLSSKTSSSFLREIIVQNCIKLEIKLSSVIDLAFISSL